MAFEADCGSSTVLEGIHVASTARPPVPAKWCSLLGPPSQRVIRGARASSPEVPGILSRQLLPGTQVRRREQKRGWVCHGVASSAKPEGRKKLKTQN